MGLASGMVPVWDIGTSNIADTGCPLQYGDV